MLCLFLTASRNIFSAFDAQRTGRVSLDFSQARAVHGRGRPPLAAVKRPAHSSAMSRMNQAGLAPGGTVAPGPCKLSSRLAAI